MKSIRFVLVNLLIFFGEISAHALEQSSFVHDHRTPGSILLVNGKEIAPLVIDQGGHPGVLRVAQDLRADIARVSDATPEILADWPMNRDSAIIVGTLGHSRFIDELVRAGKLDVEEIRGRWEAYGIFTVTNPTATLARALVIVGSDKRGTIFGTYTVSEQLGVSPWYWWADVPPRLRPAIFVDGDTRVVDAPAVKYRGIFINDEAPALAGWAKEKFGGFNRHFYEKLFELMLRLKANYLWPAMWSPSAFNEDDPANPALADEFGVVMGTSHHEPMLRSQQEWKRHGVGEWDYRNNAEGLQDFWTRGIRRNKNFESVITLGMRGDGDRSIPGGRNVELMEKVIKDQRTILHREFGQPLQEIPQVWALYKEVQEYYDHGLKVPDDVTLLFCDDNFGHLRRLPSVSDRSRSGGAGVYYHFDYFGRPRSYMWLNTVPLAKIWTQMQRAYHHAGADRIWIVNVGDLKPLEIPTEFFLSLAWSPQRWPLRRLDEYARLWATREFGAAHATEIARLVAEYVALNERKKPEYLSPETYSLVNYREAETVLANFHALTASAEKISAELAPRFRDAFFQLVLYPIKASALAQELHITIGRNRLYANQGRASTNAQAQRARDLFRAGNELARTYNELGSGKWRHVMDQPWVGFQASGSTNGILSTEWRSPARSTIPAVTEIDVPAAAEMGVAVEGNSTAWAVVMPMNFTSLAGFEDKRVPTLPRLSPFGPASRWFEVFSRGQTAFPYRISASDPWVNVTPSEGSIQTEQRVEVQIDWASAPEGSHTSTLTVVGPDDQSIIVDVPIFKPAAETALGVHGFVECDGYISIDAQHFEASKEQARWDVLPFYGRAGASVTASPGSRPAETTLESEPLEYPVYFFSSGAVTVNLEISPALAVRGKELRYAVAFDDAEPQVLKVPADETAHYASLIDSVMTLKSGHEILNSGACRLRIWLLDPEIILQKIVVETGGIRPSSFGPPPSRSFPSVRQ